MNLKQSLMVCGAFLALTNGVVSAQTTATKTAKVYTVADAHLDTQWNWDVQTTIKEYVWNTLNQNLLLLKQYPNYTIRAIADESGFNSTPILYNLFKKKTGMTPYEFKKAQDSLRD